MRYNKTQDEKNDILFERHISFIITQFNDNCFIHEHLLVVKNFYNKKEFMTNILKFDLSKQVLLCNFAGQLRTVFKLKSAGIVNGTLQFNGINLMLDAGAMKQLDRNRVRSLNDKTNINNGTSIDQTFLNISRDQQRIFNKKRYMPPSPRKKTIPVFEVVHKKKRSIINKNNKI